jgi:hypothetical protein
MPLDPARIGVLARTKKSLASSQPRTLHLSTNDGHIEWRTESQADTPLRCTHVGPKSKGPGYPGA